MRLIDIFMWISGPMTAIPVEKRRDAHLSTCTSRRDIFFRIADYLPISSTLRAMKSDSWAPRSRPLPRSARSTS